MSEPLPNIKYRVVGALVIIVSFALAWWVLLDHKVQRYHGLPDDMPERITIERFEIPDAPVVAKPQKKPAQQQEQKQEPQPAQVKQTDKPAETPQLAEAKKEAEPSTKPKQQAPSNSSTSPAALQSNKLPEAWVLQVASFTKKENAQSLETKLLQSNYPAYVKLFKLSSGSAYRVLVGPKLAKARAQTMAKEIEAKFKLKTMLISFKPGFEE